MRAGVIAFGLLLAGGVVAALLMERASAPVLSSPALRRRNYRDHELATAGGIVIVLAVLVVEGARTALAEFGWATSSATASCVRWSCSPASPSPSWGSSTICSAPTPTGASGATCRRWPTVGSPPGR